jgi:hypothetical protein
VILARDPFADQPIRDNLDATHFFLELGDIKFGQNAFLTQRHEEYKET